MRKMIYLLFWFCLPILGFAQEKRELRDSAHAQQRWDAGLFAGYSNVLGDLVVPNFTFNNPNFAYGFFIRHGISNRLAWKANLYSGRLSADDADYEELRGRNTSFSTPLIELSFNGEYELLGKSKRAVESSTFKVRFIPYLSLGAGLGFINPAVSYGGNPSLIDRETIDRNAKKTKTLLVIPFGVGIKADLSPHIYLGLEMGQRITFNDYIDGVKASGNPDDNDMYNIGGLSLGFHLNEKDTDRDGIPDSQDNCPTIKGSLDMQGCPDADGDGVTDLEDACKDVAGLKALQGCPDQDGDGIPDKDDQCPEVAGSALFAGCPDTDGDGIQDAADDCPTVAGLATLKGCPDADGDGITDEKDLCPNEAGTAANQGCPDKDNDGVLDKDDACPDIAGLKQFNGCPDTDNDGIEDRLDKCPTTFGLSSNNGCPEIKAEDKAVLAFAMSNVNFETNSAKLLASSLEVLDKVAEIMNRYPDFMLYMDGHTDNVGEEATNLRLSESRVLACSAYLQTKGISAANIRTQGFGESKPLADNKTAAGRRQNRRVEFRVEPK
ncbi:DUF6089 family protein [Haliscomenobacter hydrossis]|uniref:OmpA/MotB domain protein n=1 Tax=Haliscomenobacter hydrossis (strain ATCC 27775 / DSM 1100 / LMG 10767 / O) TaxID=760192 RepID=F4L1K7_HALH1|nr:DUF6089 family protein [Haliscomenobacter hydrossis]AEE48551.1 OmpA/MotB domain protein [Haliscomenobacter hydrossis DSM 1100]